MKIQKKIMAAHQPNFLPYLGFFDKIKKCDIFVIRDDAQFSKRDYHHRNKIKTHSGNPNLSDSKYLTVPVNKQEIPLNEIRIKRETKQKNIPWADFMIREIKNSYQNAPFFYDHFNNINEIIHGNHEYLSKLCLDIIIYFTNVFEISTPIINASELKNYFNSKNPTDDLVNLTILTESEIYLSGSGGRNYLEHEKFKTNGIELKFQDYHHPTYLQQNGPFLPYMSSLDVLLNIGKMPTIHK